MGGGDRCSVGVWNDRGYPEKILVRSHDSWFTERSKTATNWAWQKNDKHVAKHVNIKASTYQSRYINIKAELFYLKVETYFNNFQFIEQFIVKGPTILLREVKFIKIINIFVFQNDDIKLQTFF
jgi:Zn-finger nucleic acid-binding protein